MLEMDYGKAPKELRMAKTSTRNTDDLQSSKDENYEMESFYGCGDPIAKLTKKMKKFPRNKKVFFSSLKSL